MRKRGVNSWAELGGKRQSGATAALYCKAVPTNAVRGDTADSALPGHSVINLILLKSTHCVRALLQPLHKNELISRIIGMN